MITRVIPLKYINSEEVRRVFMNITAPTTRMLAYEQTNTLIITDTAANIKKLTDLIALLDIEGYDESLEVVKIKFASAEEIAKLIDQLLPGNTGVPGAPPGVPRFGGKGGPFSQRKTKEGGVISHIIADARTNSLIVSANSKGFEQVKELVKKLDTRVSLSQGGGRIHVVYLQYADAEQVAQTLGNLTSGAAAAPQKPGMPGANPTGSVLFEGAVKVAADKATNSLVVTASLSDFTLVKRVISKLDVARDQVYVEAVIMEMTMDRGFAMGTSIVNPTNGIGFLPNGDLASFLSNPLSGVTGLALGFKHGNKVSITPPGGGSAIEISSIQGLITALQSNSNSNVLATPQILTLDNQEANIEIGETVPVPSVTQVQGAGTAQSFTRERVSLNLTIKPQINKISNFVKLDIQQRFADFSNRAVPRALQDQTFGTTERSSKTTVVVQDQDTVVLGGLMRDKVSESSTKVPLLGDIPVLGWFFRAKSTQTSKTNLLVFITPRIIKHYQTIRTVLDKKLKERDDFLEETNGGVDPYEKKKLQIVKDLPPPSQLMDNYNIEDASFEKANAEEEDNTDTDELEIQKANPGLRPSAYKPKTGSVINGVSPNIPPSLQGIPQESGTKVAQPQVQTMSELPPGSPGTEAIPTMATTPADSAANGGGASQ
jgi:general secretion pathway protein D